MPWKEKRQSLSSFSKFGLGFQFNLEEFTTVYRGFKDCFQNCLRFIRVNQGWNLSKSFTRFIKNFQGFQSCYNLFEVTEWFSAFVYCSLPSWPGIRFHRDAHWRSLSQPWSGFGKGVRPLWFSVQFSHALKRKTTKFIQFLKVWVRVSV